MMYTLNIDNGVEVGLEHDLKCMPHGSLVCFEFRYNEGGGIVTAYGFILPNHYDELVLFLFDISMKYTIDHAFRHIDTAKGKPYLSAYDFHLVASTDHQTNITPEFMSSILKWKERLS